MSSEQRRARLASFWGTFALLVCLRVLWRFIIQLRDELDAVPWISRDLLRVRVGWLRPPMWRTPFLDVYLVLFLGLGLAICVSLWGLGLWRWWRELRAQKLAP